MLFPAVRKFASEKVAPLVTRMDEECQIDEGILKAMFENGVS